MNAMTLGAARFRLQDAIMTTLRTPMNQPWPSLLLDDKVANRMFAKLTVSAELALTEIFRRCGTLASSLHTVARIAMKLCSVLFSLSSWRVAGRYAENDMMTMDQFKTYFFACGALEVQQSRLDNIFKTFDTDDEHRLTRKGTGR